MELTFFSYHSGMEKVSWLLKSKGCDRNYGLDSGSVIRHPVVVCNLITYSLASKVMTLGLPLCLRTSRCYRQAPEQLSKVVEAPSLKVTNVVLYWT